MISGRRARSNRALPFFQSQRSSLLKKSSKSVTFTPHLVLASRQAASVHQSAPTSALQGLSSLGSPDVNCRQLARACCHAA